VSAIKSNRTEARRAIKCESGSDHAFGCECPCGEREHGRKRGPVYDLPQGSIHKLMAGCAIFKTKSERCHAPADRIPPGVKFYVCDAHLNGSILDLAEDLEA
jgi:hypothetical protein